MLLRYLPLLASLAVSATAVKCTNGAVVFAVRGSDLNHTTLDTNPNYDVLPDGMNATANAVIKKAGSGYIHAIPYPAINPTTGMYAQSVAIGVNATHDAVTQYIKSCKKGMVFLLGYSQGAQVVSETLGGTASVAPLQPVNRITGVVNFADPTFLNKVEPIDSGNATMNTANGDAVGANKYAYLNQTFPKRMRSFCEAGDQHCNSGSGVDATTAHAIHLDAPEVFQANATKFLVKLA